MKEGRIINFPMQPGMTRDASSVKIDERIQKNERVMRVGESRQIELPTHPRRGKIKNAGMILNNVNLIRDRLSGQEHLQANFTVWAKYDNKISVRGVILSEGTSINYGDFIQTNVREIDNTPYLYANIINTAGKFVALGPEELTDKDDMVF